MKGLIRCEQIRIAREPRTVLLILIAMSLFTFSFVLDGKSLLGGREVGGEFIGFIAGSPDSQNTIDGALRTSLCGTALWVPLVSLLSIGVASMDFQTESRRCSWARGTSLTRFLLIKMLCWSPVTILAFALSTLPAFCFALTRYGYEGSFLIEEFVYVAEPLGLVSLLLGAVCCISMGLYYITGSPLIASVISIWLYFDTLVTYINNAVSVGDGSMGLMGFMTPVPYLAHVCALNDNMGAWGIGSLAYTVGAASISLGVSAIVLSVREGR